MKKGESLFVVDLTTVSLFNENYLTSLAKDETKYKKTPFLYLVSSYVRNYSLSWASDNLAFMQKIKKGSWMIYKFTLL